jgi:hypothetical protein
MDHLHFCNHTDGSWAQVRLKYFTEDCVIERYIYTDPPRNFHFTFSFIYYIVSYIFFTYFLFYSIFSIRYWFKLRRTFTPEGDSLFTRHPDGYWQALVQVGNPFQRLFGNG